MLLLCLVVSGCVAAASGHGLLLLYRPLDISNDCAFSNHLRYDLSFGMGMSDTITLVFRTLNEMDYECGVEIVSASEEDVHILVVIKFPSSISHTCSANRDFFTVIRRGKCFRLCDHFTDKTISSNYYVITVKDRIRFRFLSNSSINADMNANLYQVTATTARLRPEYGCKRSNETTCVVDQRKYCFTSGVVCDGIKNCGFTDWFDERKSECGLPVERLGYAPVVAVAAAILCAVLAAGHVLLRCLPPAANSFFIFNANEDNRLCINPTFKSPDRNLSEDESAKKISLIPVFSSSSSNTESEAKELSEKEIIAMELQSLSMIADSSKPLADDLNSARRNTTMRSVTAKIQQKFRLVTSRGRRQKKHAPTTDV